MFTDQHKEQRMSNGRTFQDHCGQDEADLFFHIVTDDQNLDILHQCRNKTTSPKPKQFKQSHSSSRKITATVFWDENDVLLADSMEGETTIIIEVYCQMLTKLIHAIQNCRLDDNAHPPTAERTKKKIKHFDWDFLIIHPTVSTLHLVIIFSSWSSNSELVDNGLEIPGKSRQLLSVGSIHRWQSSMERD